MAAATGASARKGSALAALGHRNYRLFFFGQAISLIGTWMQSVGQQWLVIDKLTPSPFLLSLVAAAQFTPVLLLSLAAGAAADRVPKRQLVIFTQTALMVLAFALAVLTWTGRVRYWHILVLSLLLGTVSAFDMPARQSFMAELVGREDLMNGIALNSAIFNGARVIGPWVAGKTIASLGIAPAFFFNGISFLAVIAALLAMKIDDRAASSAPNRNLGRDIREGLSYIRRTPLILSLNVLMALVSTFVLNFNVLVPVIAKEVLHQDAEGFSLLMSAMGMGALLGAIVLAWASRFGPQLNLVYAGALVVSAAELGLLFAHGMASIRLLLFIAGLATIVFSAYTNSLLQTTVPDRLRGRVMSVYTLVFGGVTPIGALLTGGVLDVAGPVGGFIEGGLLGLISVAAVGVWWRRRMGQPAPAEQ
ncbi:MAG: MFS transporter [Symbiobacteriia bacterium]